VPSEELIIADSSPLIGLARIGQLGLLPKLAKRVIAPAAVHAEVTLARANAPGAAEVAAQAWIEVQAADGRTIRIGGFWFCSFFCCRVYVLHID
jgi:predicted nucleic acid-binding protein